MQAQPNPDQANPPSVPAHRDADLEQDCALLRETAEICADLLRLLHRRAIAEAAQPAPPEPASETTAETTSESAPCAARDQTAREQAAAAAERLMRAIRRTIHLRQHLRQNSLATTARRTAARAEVIRKVENQIARTRPKPGQTANAYDAEHLRLELVERIDTLEFEHEIQTRSVDDIVTDTLRDLGLSNPELAPAWPRRTPADLRALYERAKAKPPAPPPPDQPDRPNPPARTSQGRTPPNPHAGQSLLDYLLRER